ncbi:Uncharacterised protein [Shigella sonnei]|nr:Uncharacterised protein [Shigella sonnei]
MAYLAESRQRRSTYTLGRRIRRNQFWMFGFQLAQFAHQPVVFSVGNFRRIHHMIKIFMMAKRRSQFCQLLFD